MAFGSQRRQPAFTVAANTTLEGILRARPASVKELIEIKGIGPAFCEHHGESLLQALAELTERAPPSPTQRR